MLTTENVFQAKTEWEENRKDKHIQWKREDYWTNPGERQDEWGPWQTFCPPTVPPPCVCVCICSLFVCFYERFRARCEWYCANFRDSLLCKAVSVDIASMEERFLHSLRYTLINLLKPARPVSSTLTHQKSQATLNPARIFSMDASRKSLQPHSWQLSVRVCGNAYKVETNINFIIPCDGKSLVGRQMSQGVMKPLKQSSCWFVLLACIFCLSDNRHFHS